MSEHGIKKMEAIGFIELYHQGNLIKTRCFHHSYERTKVIEQWYSEIKKHNHSHFYYQISYKWGKLRTR